MSDDAKAPMRFDHLWWASFWCTSDDYRPLADPPNEAILGWWCSGHRMREAGGLDASLCLLVVGMDEQDVRAQVAKDWPEALDAEWRFCEARPSTDLGDRFPLNDWNRARIAAFNTRQ